jgi:uncharacterized protein
MILPDLNLLLYAYNPHPQQHHKAAEWWNGAVNSEELIGIPNEICLGFVLIASNPRLGIAAVSVAEARAVVTSWLDLPQARILSPSANHFQQVMDLAEAAQIKGAVISDAVLAAFAIQHRATLYSSDTDFSKFRDLSWKNPLSD